MRVRIVPVRHRVARVELVMSVVVMVSHCFSQLSLNDRVGREE